MRYEPDELDPATIHLKGDFPVKDLIEGFKVAALERAHRTGQYVSLFHVDQHEGRNDPEGGVTVKSFDAAMYEKGLIQCPQAADEEYKLQTGKPRPLPSVLVTPDLDVIVAKSSLCDTCVHRLGRALSGSCVGKQYEPLED